MKSFHVKGTIVDLIAFLRLVPRRRRVLRRTPVRDLETPYINVLSDKLHPREQHFVIDNIVDETAEMKTYRLVPDSAEGSSEPASFRAGQYVAIKEIVDGYPIARAYSIASSPTDARNGFYDITVKRSEGGFLTTHMWNEWEVGTPVTTTGPFGFMYHEPIRDSSTVVGIAGGSGVTPFRSIAREIAAGALDIRLTLLYGCNTDDEIAFKAEFDDLSRTLGDRFNVVYVIADGAVSEGTPGTFESGFITEAVIAAHSAPSADSYFVCGPPAMYDYIGLQLESLSIPRKRIRMEAYGEIRDPRRFEDYPSEAFGRRYTITVQRENGAISVPATGEESILTALERAKVAPPAVCRSGECQMCRIRITSGDVWVSPKSDGRRRTDRMSGFVHPCVTFPLSDLDVKTLSPA